MDNPFRGALLDYRNGLSKIFFSLFFRFVGYGGSHRFDHVFHAGLIGRVSCSFYIILSGPFNGRFMVCQDVDSCY